VRRPGAGRRLVGERDVLIGLGEAMGMGGNGIRRIAVARGPGGWKVEEHWTSRGLKPYFNDYVVHKGHAFGFDGTILSCIGLENGDRKWKGGRYGAGQMLLLPDQDVLLVLSEEGELALVRAPQTSSRRSRGSRRSRARHGTTRCWSATSCWFATLRRWPRSGSPSRPLTGISLRGHRGCWSLGATGTRRNASRNPHQ
jgi:hypothetical protein